jgi:hypothetical protein
MNFGEIRIFRFKRAQSGAKAIPANVGIDAPAQLVIVDEEMPVAIYVFVAMVHVGYRWSGSRLIGSHCPPRSARNAIAQARRAHASTV